MSSNVGDQASLSFAAYAVLAAGRTIDQIGNLEAQGFTAMQARAFAKRYPTVVDSFDDQSSGFQVAVFKDSLDDAPGNISIAFRGTQLPEDVPTALDIVGAGCAYAQVVSMVNWWLAASTPAGQGQMAVQYRLASYAIGNVPENAVVLREDGATAFVLEAAPSILATGVLAAALNA
ncbi:MAG: hypothetical protein ACRD5Z_09245, partial [Bryobacteraceae bacterium]